MRRLVCALAATAATALGVATAPPAPAAIGDQIRVQRAGALIGVSTIVNGRIGGAGAGVRVSLQRGGPAGWVTTDTGTTGPGGLYTVLTKPPALGVYTYRVVNTPAPGVPALVRGTFGVVRYRAEIATIHADAAGNDADNLNDEYAVVRNTSPVGINLAAWVLDAGDRGQRRALPRYGLRPGATVRVHTGGGRVSAGHIFLGFGTPIWNNRGDRGRLFDPNGNLASAFRASPRAVPAPAPRSPAPRPAPVTPRLDPRFGTCRAAIAAGYGPYVRGRDPEYAWYRDADSDGIVCER